MGDIVYYFLMAKNGGQKYNGFKLIAYSVFGVLECVLSKKPFTSELETTVFHISRLSQQFTHLLQQFLLRILNHFYNETGR